MVRINSTLKIRKDAVIFLKLKQSLWVVLNKSTHGHSKCFKLTQFL